MGLPRLRHLTQDVLELCYLCIVRKKDIMTSTEIKKAAEKIFKAVKNTLAERRKYNKEKGLTDVQSWSRYRQQADIEIWDNNEWNDGTRHVASYTIKVEDKKVVDIKNRYDIDDVFRELRNLLDEQKKAKGWGGLNYDFERLNIATDSWRDYEVKVIRKVCLADAVCPEYKSLMNYVNKYGKTKYGGMVNLKNYELFSAAMGGKRGYLWDEHGERLFLDNKPKKSTKFLDELRKARGTKDIMICERGEENYLDDEERRYSEYAEVECEGEKRRYLRITIKTPTGRVKLDTKIY